MPDLSVSLAGVPLRTPLLAAAGTCGYGTEFRGVLDFRDLGALVTKSITREPRVGNPPWRVVDLPCGMLNAVGLANVGLDRFLAEKLPDAASLPTVLVGSIAGGSVEDYLAVAAAFDREAALPAVELNVSCPNTAEGLVFGEDPRALAELVREVRPALASTRLLVKLSPNVGDVVALARAAVDAGADALTLINTLKGLSIDVETRRPRLANGPGGISGPAIHPLAVRMVHEVHRGVARDAGVPLVGLGGVTSWQDAAELVLAGASAVGLGTVLFADPGAPGRVLRGLRAWVDRHGAASLAELVGKADA